jgi:hypothetical protein
MFNGFVMRLLELGVPRLCWLMLYNVFSLYLLHKYKKKEISEYFLFISDGKVEVAE